MPDNPTDCFAHSTDTIDKSDWQKLRDHLEQVAQKAHENASHFGAEKLGRVAGLLHDLGKYTREFQLRLSGAFGKVDHTTWGARIACERYGQVGRLLAYGIAGHHAGLANGVDGIVRRALKDRLENEPKHGLLSIWKEQLDLPDPAGLRVSGFEARKERIGFQQSMLARMLFSCLVDADYLDTEEFYTGTPRDRQYPSLDQLRDSLNEKLGTFKADTEVNRWRAEILAHVRKQADCSPGLFSLTVPTGGGKTLISLAFALDHAIAHGLRRVIFVIPFTSIVEQNARVFREAFGETGKNAVLEHHSAFSDSQVRTQDSRDKLRQAMENWDAPVIVTTAVQFFESLFSDRPSRCRKLHNISRSAIILDEAQTLPLKVLRCCMAALDELALNYRASIVLCTATQPALEAKDGFRNGFQGVRELAPSPEILYERFRRVKVSFAGRLKQEEIVGALRRHKQALCIVNNRRHARALHYDIASDEGAYHLSTLMCAAHRSVVLSEVRTMLKENRRCRLVATSLIEAGVDIDFPFVMRAEAGLDSIAQAAGRCNREGLRPAKDSEVAVFTPDSDEWAPPPELKQFGQVYREIQRLFSDDPLSLEAIREYFKLLYWQKGPEELDYYDLLGVLQGSRIENLPFETLGTKFRMIENVQRPVIIPFNKDARAALSALEHADSCGAIARRLQRYLVTLPRQAYDALRAAGAIQPKFPERYGEQFMELINQDLYDKNVGLRWEDPSFIKGESLYV
jgi:CRISPR-associated endonuclease/helicase Cas3